MTRANSARTVRLLGMAMLLPSVFVFGCQRRANPNHFDIRDLVVTEDKLTCELILAGSPGQVMSRYETKTEDRTAAVVVFVKTRLNGRMDDAFRRLEVPIAEATERVVITDGEQARELWHR